MCESKGHYFQTSLSAALSAASIRRKLLYWLTESVIKAEFFLKSKITGDLGKGRGSTANIWTRICRATAQPSTSRPLLDSNNLVHNLTQIYSA